MGLKVLLIFALLAQTDEPLTNSGEPFQDPFADSDTADPEPQPDVETETEAESFSEPSVDSPEGDANQEESFSDPFEETSPEPDPEVEAPALPPSESEEEVLPPASTDSPPISPPSDSFKFPDADRPDGPVSQEVDRRLGVVQGSPEGTWQFSLKPGVGINFNRRPTQVSFEAEVGYRLWRALDLNFLTNMRFVTDRIMGFILMPSYSWKLTGSSLNRWDLRVGLGTGWVLRGVSGMGYQYGYLPIRSDLQITYYPSSRLGLFASAGTETHVLRVSTQRQYFNEFSDPNGAPTQALVHLGIRMEF